MSGQKLTLVGILVFVLLVVGSFIGFVVNWDSDREQSVTQGAPMMMEDRRA